MTLKFLVKIFLIVLISVFFCLPFVVSNAEVKGDVTVAAIVPSKVSKDKSKVSVYPSEVLADNVQRTIVTVKVADQSGNPMPNIKIRIISNRGVIDSIRELNSEDSIATTDMDGVAYFEVTSSVPGDVVLTSTADTLVELSSVGMTFLPLPFPKNVTISVAVPKFISPTGEVVLLNPSGEKESGKTSEKDKTVNLGVNVKVPFWIIAIAIMSAIMNIVLFLLLFSMMIKMSKTEKEEEKILEKEEEVLEKISDQND